MRETPVDQGPGEKGVHTVLIPGSTDAKVQGEFYDRSGRQRRYRQSTRGQAKRGCIQV